MVNTHRVGLIFGKFYPLHCGHIYMIEKALSQVDELHIMLGCEAKRDEQLFVQSQLPRQVQAINRLSWLESTFKQHDNLYIHLLDESGIDTYPNGWRDWSERVKQLLQRQQVTPDVIFTSEPQDVDNHQRYFNCKVELIDAERQFMPISATQIRQDPYTNWHYIAKAAQPFLVKRIAILGNTVSGNLAAQFANIFNTIYISNGYVNYLYSDLEARQFTPSAYEDIARLLAERIVNAQTHAYRYLFTDMTFASLQKLYQQAFNEPNKVIADLENSYPFDLVLDVHDCQESKTREACFNQVQQCLAQSLLVNDSAKVTVVVNETL